MENARYELPEKLILDRQAGLLRTFFKFVAALTAVALLLIAFLPGFATSHDVQEPFLRNVVVMLVLGALYYLVEKGFVLAAIYGTIGSTAFISSYTIYVELPGNPQMMALIMFPTCLAGFLPKRTQFWTVYVLNFLLMLFTAWLITDIKGIPVEPRSIITLGMLLTLLALLVDTLSSSYRESIRTTFNQLLQINAAHERLNQLDEDLGVAQSEKQKAESVSHQLERTGRLALEVAGAGAIGINLDRNLVDVSPDFFARYAIKPPSNLEELSACVHPQDRAKFELLFSQSVSSRDRLEGDFRIGTDETAVYWLFMFEVGVNERGEQTLSGITVDVTARMLEQQQRTLEDNKVRESQRLESLGVMAGAIAHDFNNLLHVIMLNADLARQDLNPDSRTAISIDRMMTTVDRAAELCSELLAYSGKGQFSIEPFNMEMLIGEMKSLLDISTPKGVSINIETAATNSQVNGDITQIRQVILNLITNAGEALDNSGGSINISINNQHCDESFFRERDFMEVLPDADYVCICIRDNGCGMDKRTMQRMFDPFFSTKETGHGLGLSAVLGIVRGHNGSIEVKSSPGEGTTFTLLFPVSHVLAQEPVLPRPALTNTTGAGTILFADDEPEIRVLAKAVLVDSGYEVLEASDGHEAVSLFQQHSNSLRLVILDLMMPNKTGLEAYLEITKLDSSVPVVFSSGFNESEILDRLPAKTRSAFLKKPYLAADLEKFVHGLIGPRV